MIITVSWIAVAVVALVLYLRQVYATFSKNRINHLPVIPIFGGFFWAFFKFESATKPMMRLADAFPENKYILLAGQRNFLCSCRTVEMMKPIYMVHDVDIIKNVTIKDFDHFVDRRSFVSEFDPLFGRGLINLKGDEWKEMRSTLSPAFTSSKMRLMVPFMVDVGVEMIKVLKSKIIESGNKHIEVNLKDLTTRYANDVIATCAFGLKEDSQASDSYFYVKAKDATTFGVFRIFKVFFCRTIPSVANMLGLTMVSPKTSNFFKDVVLTTIEERDKKNIVRHDMINLLNDIKKGKLSHEKETDTDAGFATVEESNVRKKLHNREWSDQDLVAQAALFLVAGFDTVSTGMSFIINELALNQDVQDRLREEIMEYDVKNGGKLDFNSIQSMKYMDMVVSEGLRKYPPAPLLDRKCVKDYNLGRPNKNLTKDLIIRKGDIVGFPIWTFHHNPELYPSPDKFDPDRFSEENKHNIKSFSYMPFGHGPRNCIGSRFALCELKVILYQLLRDMKVIPSDQTLNPPQLAHGFMMGLKNGFVKIQVN